jgi:hypothetical protein
MPSKTRTIAAALVLIVSQVGVARAIDYNEPQSAQRFGGNGWLIDSGNDHGTTFKAFVETKSLLVAPDAIYYAGVERIETVEQGTPGKIHWHFRARCAVRPDLVGNMPIGIYTSSPEISPTEQFREVNPKAGTAPDMASRGWYNLWWAACRGAVKKF